MSSSQPSLFPISKNKTPLAETLRPLKKDELIGNTDIVQSDILLSLNISFIFWGPSGTGKTSLARIIGQSKNFHFINFSAVSQGISDLKKIINTYSDSDKKILLFIDEIHRFNKSQQDFLLPNIENGTIKLIGATTENPSFSINHALLSRIHVFQFKKIRKIDLNKILENALFKLGLNQKISIEQKGYLIDSCNGDARSLINNLEISLNNNKLDDKILKKLQKKISGFSRNSDDRYHFISALHKSIRASDCDAALIYLSKMIQQGEDPIYIIRRLIRVSVEDIGIANPNLINLAISTLNSYQQIGSPEGDLLIANLVINLSLSYKSNSVYLAWNKVNQFNKNNDFDIPISLLNADTKLQKEMGYSKDYKYDHNYLNNFSGQNCMPSGISEKFYIPQNNPIEKEIEKKMNEWEKIRNR